MNKFWYYLFMLLASTIGCKKEQTDTSTEATIELGTRNPVLRPFSRMSIWNMPIGDEAIYEPANLAPAGNVGADVVHVILLSESDPKYPVLDCPTFGPGRCSGTTDLGYTLRFPADKIIADAGNSEYGLTPNANYALIMPDQLNVLQGSKIARCEIDGPIYLPDWTRFPDNRQLEDLKGSETKAKLGGQGASGMSALGGTIRKGELTNDEPIRHVLKVNPWAEKYLHYSTEVPGYKFPAKSADGYAAQVYNKSANPNLVMGTLLALPTDLTPESLNLTTKAGEKLFYALQHYGVYFTEDAAYDTWDLIVEEAVVEEFVNVYGFSLSSTQWRTEVNKLMVALEIITNNAPNSIGGGGVPIAPLAADFE
ncbi:MAG: hypothetical protein AAGJ18_07920 [Bacteroidota bacterium]